MPATIVARTEDAFTIQVEIPYGPSMLDAEETLQQRLNEAGTLATAEILQRFDTDGSPIQVGDTKLTSKGKLLKEYQTPYGVAPVERHVYQGAGAARPTARSTATPASSSAPPPSSPRWSRSSTPSSARRRVIKDLAENHGRPVARCFVQNVADAVAAVALAKEEDWEYALPELEGPTATITIGMDGTCLLLCEEGWRETMVGTIGFYDERASGSTRSTWGRRPSTARRRSWSGWSGRSSG